MHYGHVLVQCMQSLCYLGQAATLGFVNTYTDISSFTFRSSYMRLSGGLLLLVLASGLSAVITDSVFYTIEESSQWRQYFAPWTASRYVLQLNTSITAYK